MLLLDLFLNLHVHVHWKHFSLADSPVLQWCFSAPVVARLIKLHVLFFLNGHLEMLLGLLTSLGPKNFLRQQPWGNVLNDCIFLANINEMKLKLKLQYLITFHDVCTTHLSSVLQNIAVIIWALVQQNKSSVWKCKTDVTQHIRDVMSSLWNSPKLCKV